MIITDELIDYVASLARLSLSDDEKVTIKKDLGSILDYMDILNGLDTSGIEPMTHINEETNVFRQDEVKPSFDREELLSLAPDRTEVAYLVPKTVE